MSERSSFEMMFCVDVCLDEKCVIRTRRKKGERSE